VTSDRRSSSGLPFVRSARTRTNTIAGATRTDVPGAREIPNYEPSDKGWGVVVGPLREPPAPKPQAEEQPAEDGKEPQPSED
jgi:hypothetical protein